MRKTIFMHKLFSSSVKEEYKNSALKATEKAFAEGSAEFDDDGNILTLEKEGDSVIVTDPENDEKTVITVNPEDEEDYQVIAAEDVVPDPDPENFCEDGKNKKFSAPGTDPAPDNIVENLDGDNMNPEAQVEIIKGTDGKHYSIIGKNFSKADTHKFMRAFSAPGTDPAPDNIVENLDGDNMNPEADVEIIKGTDGKHYSVKAQNFTHAQVKKVLEMFSDENPEPDNIKENNAGTPANPESNITGDEGVVDPEKAGTVEETRAQSENHQDGRNVEYNGELWICLKQWADKCVICKGEGDDVKTVPTDQLKFFSSPEEEEAFKAGEEYEEGKIKGEEETPAEGDETKTESEPAAEDIESLKKSADELQEKVNELQETQDKDLAKEVRTLTEELLDKASNVEGSDEIKSMCDNFSKMCSEILDIEETPTEESAADPEPETEIAVTPMSKLLGMTDKEAADENETGKPQKEGEPEPSGDGDPGIAPKVDPNEAGDSEKTFSATGAKAQVGTNSYLGTEW